MCLIFHSHAIGSHRSSALQQQRKMYEFESRRRSLPSSSCVKRQMKWKNMFEIWRWRDELDHPQQPRTSLLVPHFSEERTFTPNFSLVNWNDDFLEKRLSWAFFFCGCNLRELKSLFYQLMNERIEERRSSTTNEAEKRKDQIRSDMFRLKNEGEEWKNEKTPCFMLKNDRRIQYSNFVVEMIFFHSLELPLLVTESFNLKYMWWYEGEKSVRRWWKRKKRENWKWKWIFLRICERKMKNLLQRAIEIEI